MSFQIVNTPEIPALLVEEIHKKNIAFFIGAGVSRLLGCPGWTELTNNFVDLCYNKGYINYRFREILKQYNDPKKVITICQKIFIENDDESSFLLNMWLSFQGKEYKILKYNLYNIFNDIDALYITTNIDNHFNKQFLHDRLIYNFDGIQELPIYHNKLYKIHGTLCDIKNIIFTVPDYIKLYNNVTFRKFLEGVFERYTVIFVGYGMEEFELLDFMITKLGEVNAIKHYILKPYYKGEEELLKFDKMYFNSLGVDVIGFSKDDNGYNQLYEVIKYWYDEITKSSTVLYDTITEMEEIIDGYERKN